MGAGLRPVEDGDQSGGNRGAADERGARKQARPKKEPREPFGLRRRGKRPEPLWGRFPLSEIVIAIGITMFVLGLIRGPEEGATLLGLGVLVCAIAVVEVTLREHLTGYRRHVLVLSFIPTVAFQTTVGLLFGWTGIGPSGVSIVLFLALATTLNRVWHHASRRREAERRRTGRLAHTAE